MEYEPGRKLTVVTKDSGLLYLIKQEQLYLANWPNIALTGVVLSQDFSERTLLNLGPSKDDDKKLKLSDVDLSGYDPTLELRLAVIGEIKSDERANTIKLLSYLYGVPDDITGLLSDYRMQLLWDLNNKKGNTYAFLREDYFTLR